MTDKLSIAELGRADVVDVMLENRSRSALDGRPWGACRGRFDMMLKSV